MSGDGTNAAKRNARYSACALLVISRGKISIVVTMYAGKLTKERSPTAVSEGVLTTMRTVEITANNKAKTNTDKKLFFGSTRKIR